MAVVTLRSEDGKLRFRWSEKYVVDDVYTRHCPEVYDADEVLIETLAAHPSFEDALKEIRQYVSKREKGSLRDIKAKDVKLYWVFDEIDAIESELTSIRSSLSDLTLAMHRQNAIDMEGVIKRVWIVIDRVKDAQHELVRASEA